MLAYLYDNPTIKQHNLKMNRSVASVTAAKAAAAAAKAAAAGGVVGEGGAGGVGKGGRDLLAAASTPDSAQACSRDRGPQADWLGW